MRVLVEQYSYKVEDLPVELRKLERESNGKVSFDRVGYFLDAKVHDCVFILPKVVLWEDSEKVLGEFTPEEFVDLEALEKKYPEKKARIKEVRRFVYEFSTWIYRALKVYRKGYPDNDIVLERHTQHTGHTGRRRKSETLLDVLLSIQDFARENRDFFFFVVKNRHSGQNKINWTRTIAKSAAVVQYETPAYLNPVNKKRQINFDEELLVVFFSILNYMNEKYGFSVKTDLGYELITGSRFDAYVEKGLGKRRLLKIKYKYFSDKALKLWDLCYAFFEKEHQIFLTGDHEEYLLVKKFNIVFEAMIDELIGDRKDELPKSLTKQDDGKQVDHMYLYRELIENKVEQVDTFYIGDSKYYKYGTQLGKEAVYKQFTYAKNVIQWRLNLFMQGGDESEEMKSDKQAFVAGKKLRNIRDDVTEGYDITPNFFISAMMTEDLRGGFKDEKAVPTTHGGGKQFYVLKQFENRLFDRDTLIVTHYDVNFLFVLSLYAQDKAYRKAAWKSRVQEQFRREIRKMLAEQFDFYAITPKATTDAEAFFRENFKDVIGRAYDPYGVRGVPGDGKGNGARYYSVALSKDPKFRDDNEYVLGLIAASFKFAKCEIDAIPEDLQGLAGEIPQKTSVVSANHLTMHWLENYRDADVLLGFCKSDAHLEWMLNRTNKECDVYNVRVGAGVHGAVDIRSERVQNVKFLILYRATTEADGWYRVFRVRKGKTCRKEWMIASGYDKIDSRRPVGNRYYCYYLEEEVSLGDLDAKRLVAFCRLARMGRPDYVDYAPDYIKGSDVLPYRR